jgi:hypothetical protein
MRLQGIAAAALLAAFVASHGTTAAAKEPCVTVHCPKCRYCGCVRPPYGCSTGCHRFNGFCNQIAAYRQLETSWHGDYYHVAWGTPVSLVVPPTAEMQTDYHWGVGGTRITPIWHQFRPGFPGYAAPGVAPVVFLPTPRWPSDTNQFGVYYNRGPW